jgi:hypothetical protein
MNSKATKRRRKKNKKTECSHQPALPQQARHCLAPSMFEIDSNSHTNTANSEAHFFRRPKSSTSIHRPTSVIRIPMKSVFVWPSSDVFSCVRVQRFLVDCAPVISPSLARSDHCELAHDSTHLKFIIAPNHVHQRAATITESGSCRRGGAVRFARRATASRAERSSSGHVACTLVAARTNSN